MRPACVPPHAHTTAIDVRAALSRGSRVPDARRVSIGAIHYFAVTAEFVGIDIATVGVILMIIGALGLIITLVLLSRDRRERPAY